MHQEIWFDETTGSFAVNEKEFSCECLTLQIARRCLQIARKVGFRRDAAVSVYIYRSVLVLKI